MHTFKYGKREAEELKKYCKKTYYYNRETPFKKIFSTIPYIVNSRKSIELENNLISVNAPILFEGIHTTSPLRCKALNDRTTAVRTHNIEHDYYKYLFRSEKNVFKKIYFLLESIKLRSYEKIINNCNFIFAISKFEQQYFEENYNSKSIYLPAFHSNTSIKNLSNKGNFAFYHGNLKISDNIRAVDYLIDVFKTLDYQLVVAGNIENTKFQNRVNRYENINFIQLGDQNQLNQLFMQAHINVLPSFQKTGIKLKLLNSLFNGRFCIVNPEMVEGTGLESLCYITKNKLELKKQILNLINSDYKIEEITQRKSSLKDFDNKKNAKKIAALLIN